MKTAFFKAGYLALAFSCVSQTWAVLPPANQPLPNFDKRTQVARPAVTVAEPAKANARAVLQSRVPGLKLSTDAVLGTPRMLTARRGFLTGPEGGKDEPPPPPPTAIVTPVHISSGVHGPRKITDVPPIYPSVARAAEPAAAVRTRADGPRRGRCLPAGGHRAGACGQPVRLRAQFPGGRAGRIQA